MISKSETRQHRFQYCWIVLSDTVVSFFWWYITRCWNFSCRWIFWLDTLVAVLTVSLIKLLVASLKEALTVSLKKALTISLKESWQYHWKKHWLSLKKALSLKEALTVSFGWLYSMEDTLSSSRLTGSLSDTSLELLVFEIPSARVVKFPVSSLLISFRDWWIIVLISIIISSFSNQIWAVEYRNNLVHQVQMLYYQWLSHWSSSRHWVVNWHLENVVANCYHTTWDLKIWLLHHLDKEITQPQPVLCFLCPQYFSL